MHSARPGRVVLAALAVMLAVAVPAASAHVSKSSGPFRVDFGWAEEPPLTGVENAVEVEVFEASGARVDVPAGTLSVEVSYGDAAVTLPLAPSDRPGLLEADLVPTRPGAYAFHVTGTVRTRTLDVSATCSDATFQCVEASTVAEFPVNDPSAGELWQRISRESDRAQEASDAADSAWTVGIVAIVLAAVAVVLSLRLARRSARS